MPKNPHANFRPTLESYSGQGAFRFWCQMALPLTYDDSLSYYELLNKVVTYLNNTIEDVGKVEDNVAALNEAYGKLEDYVNTYFDEIDIEAELRNVLDAMAEDGSLDSLLDPLVAARLGDVVAEQISGVVANQIDGAVSEQIGGAVLENLPAVVPDAVNDWLDSNVTPTTPIVDKTLTISDAAADAKVTGDRITDLKSAFMMNLFDSSDPTYIENAYIDGNGNQQSANAYFISNRISCPGGGKTYVCSYASTTGTTPVRIYNASGSRLANATGTLSSDGKYLTFNIPASNNVSYFTVNGRTTITEFMIVEGTVYPSAYIPQIGLSKDVALGNNDDYKALAHGISVINDALDIVEGGSETITVSAAITGYFVNASQNRVDASPNYNITNSISLSAGQTLSFTAKGYLTNVGMICLYDANSDSYTTVVPSADSNTNDYRYTATTPCVVRCSYSTSVTPVAVIITSETGSQTLKNIESILENFNINEIEYPLLFSNVVFVGDSLTYGYDGSSQQTKNYPYFFGKLTECTVSNQGLSGRTAKQWWDELGVTFDFTGFDCAIIYLGTNGGLTDTVSTDCNASDYTQNANTNTGCYGKIIGKIKATNPNCKIFLIAGPEEYHSRTSSMNPAVRSLTSFYSVGLLDMEDSILSDDGSSTSMQRILYRPMDGIHYDVLGYLTFANIVYNLMRTRISNNLSEYKYA